MRPALAIFCLIVCGVVLAAVVSLRTPHPDPLASEMPPTPATNSDTTQPPVKPAAKPSADVENLFDKVRPGMRRASLEIVGKGMIELELYPKAAPKTVAHIAELAGKNFWDGVKVHRVEAAVVQMGDPMSKDAALEEFDAKGIGSHGSGATVPLEVSAKLPNIQYTVGLARSEALDSGDSQFFINLTDNPEFDYKYCVFGRVVKGTDVVNKIVKGDVIKHIQVYEAGQK